MTRRRKKKASIRPKKGRPTFLTEDGEAPILFQIKLPKGLARRLKAAAERRQEPRSKTVRALMERHLPPAERPKPKAPPVDLAEVLAQQPSIPEEQPRTQVEPYNDEDPPAAFDPISGTYRFPGE